MFIESFLELPRPIRIDVEYFCGKRGFDYRDIHGAERGDLIAMGKVNALIGYLKAQGHSAKYISKAVNQDFDYTLRRIKYLNEPETPVKTTDWDRIT